MAKNRRQKKKFTKEELKGVLLSSGYSKREVNKLTSKQLENLSNTIIQEQEHQKQRTEYISFWEKDEVKKEQQKILKRRQARDLHSRKSLALQELGFDPQYITTSITRKLTLKDIEDIKSGKKEINRYTHPDLYPYLKLNETQIRFNYSKVYKASPSKEGEPRAYYFAFLDMTGEEDLEELMMQAKRKTSKELIQAIINLLRTPPSYKRGKSASSGKAGLYRYYFDTVKILKAFHGDTRKYSRHYKRLDNMKKKRRIHTKNNARSYQVLWNTKKGCNYFEELSVKSMLEIMYVFMDNVAEHERFNFFDEFYTDLINGLDLTKEEREKLILVLPNPDVIEG